MFGTFAADKDGLDDRIVFIVLCCGLSLSLSLCVCVCVCVCARACVSDIGSICNI